MQSEVHLSMVKVWVVSNIQTYYSLYDVLKGTNKMTWKIYNFSIKQN